MTPIEEKNLKIMKDSMNLAGFQGMYDKAIADGILAGDKEIKFDPPAYKKYDDLLMVWQPKMTEGKTPGLYNFNGFQATLFKDEKELATQFISNFKTKGMTLDNSYTALMGGTVLHSDWDTDRDVKRMVFTRFDMTQTNPQTGQHPIIRVNAERVNLSALMSQENIAGNTTQIGKILAELQTGKPVFAQVREKVEGVDKQVPVFLMLNLKDTKEMGMQVIDPSSGELRRERVELVTQRQMTKTEGLEVSQSKETALPEGVLRSLNAPRNELGTEDGKQMMSPDALLRRFNGSKKQETAKDNGTGKTAGDTTKTETQIGGEKKDGKVPDNVKPLLDPNRNLPKGTGKKNVA
jgi:hypothetical protein